MEAALITKEQIQSIVKALWLCEVIDNNDHQTYQEALAVINSLIVGESDTTSDSATRSADSAESFCDSHCTWRDHHPECKFGDPEQEPPSECRTEGEKRAYAFGWWKALEVNRKEWVGLTDEELNNIPENGNTDWMKRKSFARAIETKIKELNT